MAFKDFFGGFFKRTPTIDEEKIEKELLTLHEKREDIEKELKSLENKIVNSSSSTAIRYESIAKATPKRRLIENLFKKLKEEQERIHKKDPDYYSPLDFDRLLVLLDSLLRELLSPESNLDEKQKQTIKRNRENVNYLVNRYKGLVGVLNHLRREELDEAKELYRELLKEEQLREIETQKRGEELLKRLS